MLNIALTLLAIFIMLKLTKIALKWGLIIAAISMAVYYLTGQNIIDYLL